jgi:hypothetical protein
VNIPVRPSSFAQDEIEYYLRRYESESPGLGDKLWQDIQTAAELISRSFGDRGTGPSHSRPRSSRSVAVICVRPTFNWGSIPFDDNSTSSKLDGYLAEGADVDDSPAQLIAAVLNVGE